MEGEEEAGSPNLEAAVRAHPDRVRGDALILVDGPRHASDRPTLNFGSRGLMGATITVYGASRDLHSGNYGNWAPNPALDLARLLASMKQADGRVTVDGFYDDVVPLTPAERQAIDEIPDVEATLMQAYGFTRRENAAERLELRHNQPTINVNAIEAGGGVGGQGRTIIPGSASAKIDVRLVKAIDPAKQFDRIVAHVRKQGYFVVETEPDAATRAAHPMLARVDAHRRLSGRTHVDGDAAGRVDREGAVGRRRRPARAAADDRRQHAVLSVRGRARRADLRAVDRQLRQQPARAEREPADQEPVGRDRLDGGAADDEVSGGTGNGLHGVSKHGAHRD